MANTLVITKLQTIPNKADQSVLLMSVSFASSHFCAEGHVIRFLNKVKECRVKYKCKSLC